MSMKLKFTPANMRKLFSLSALILVCAVAFAHTVTGYTPSCNAGPQYSIKPLVSNVNSSSNYRWQYKSGSSWICIVNGNNTINGNTYNVTGAVYNLTTNPGSLVFTNPNSGLNGVVIRCIISDGNGVNPCNLPSGNTWNSDGSSTNLTINVSSTPCAATGSIGDRVWLDVDGDGIQDASETGGISGVSVQLKNSGGTVISTVTTNASGNYLFSELVAGNYTVVFPTSITAGVLTTANAGSDDNVDSDPSVATGATATITLAASQNITSVDAGYIPTFTLGDKVWYDTDNDGINDAAEAGIKNVTVNLYKDANNDNVADGASIASDITDASGLYSFAGLTAGNYIVGVVIPNGYMSSAVNGGDPDNNTNLDDNGQVASGTEVRGLAITLSYNAEPTSGNTNNTYDFGLLPDCSCATSASNLLVNGSFESGTTGWSASGGTLTTGTGYVACGAKNGFNNWSSGTAKVWQDVNITAGSTAIFKGFAGTHTAGIGCAPKLSLIFLNASNTVLSQSDVVVTRDVDVNSSQLEQYSITAVAPAGATKVRVQSAITCNTMKIDAFCLNITAPPVASLGDRVWKDDNSNGIQDAGETGIAGATVTLTKPDNSTVSTTTDANGIYSFTNLAPGTYKVTFTTPAGYIPSMPNNELADDANDSDPVDGVVSGITLVGGQNDPTIDAAFIKLVNLSGNVWHDVNGMNDNLVNNSGAAQTPPASGIPVGLRVYLVNLNTGLIEKVTFVSGSTGTYSFTDVTPNTNYKVSISSISASVGNPPPASTLPSGWQHTGQKLGITPGNDSINDGRLTVPVGYNDVINANFGIKLQSGEVVIG
jgi:serine-aspartate repeat-containing protein C/D/E